MKRSRSPRREAALLAAAAVVVLAPAARAFCPSYAPGSSANTLHCGVAPAPGSNPTPAEWRPMFELVAGGAARWGGSGPSAAAVGTIAAGCGLPEARHEVDAVFPCELLRAIAMQESGWRQFCVPDSPADQAGPPERTLISFDCGYGAGQVTSGMHTGEMPAFDRSRVAGDPTYNLATGTLILAGKWRATSCVGDNQPSVVEDWYSATWAYNGLAYVNNPNNPNYDAHRPPCDPGGACSARPYQERVFGWMEFPPSAEYWTALAPAYPDRGGIGMSGSPGKLPEPSCAGPTDCTNKRTTHRSACLGGAAFDGGSLDAAPAPDDGGSGGGGGGCGCVVGGGRSAGEGASVALMLLLGGLAVARRWRPGRRKGVTSDGISTVRRDDPRA